VSAAFVWQSARKDFTRRLRDPLALLLWIGIPVVIGGLILLVSGGGGEAQAPKARLWIVDSDESFLSGALVNAFTAPQSAQYFEVEQLDEVEGRRRIEKGDGSALLVIPAGFGDAVLNETPSKLELVTNPSQRILPGIVEEMLSILVDGVYYAHRILPDDVREQMRKFSAGPGAGASVFPDLEIAAFSVEINRTVERLKKYLFPPVMQLETAVEEQQGQGLNFGLLFFPSMIFMALFFVAQGLSDEVWKERAQGTLRRASWSPQSIASFFGGKLIASALIFAPVCLMGVGLGIVFFDFEVSSLPVALLWGVGTGVALTALMTLIQLHATSQRAGSFLTNLILFPLIMIGGAFFPFEAMPAWMAAVGRRTPNGWALEELKAILLGKAQAPQLALAFVGLAAVLAVLAWLCVERLKRRFAKV
jgi:ABC-type multidrug transport system permease subunit